MSTSSIPALDQLPEAGAQAVSFAAMGKSAVALIVIVGVLLAMKYLLQRLQTGTSHAPTVIQVISTRAIGQKEKIAVVEIEGRRLILGVTAAQITKLSEYNVGNPRNTGDNAALSGDTAS